MNKNTAVMMVKNEDRFIWYSIASVLPYVSRFIIFDTGSTDKTVKIIKTFKSSKIIFLQKNKTSPALLTSYRQIQADMVEKGWLWIVDGDEIYPVKTAKKVISLMNGNYIGIIIHRYDLLGDIYHYQDESVGTYNQFGKIGHYVLRAINKDKIMNLQVLGDYPDEYFAENGRSVKEKGKGNFVFVEERIFHAMYLQRSSKGSRLQDVLNRNKYKIETGKKIDKNVIPEIFYKKHSSIILDVTGKRSNLYNLTASLISPIKKVKRQLYKFK